MSQDPKRASHETGTALPPPFGALNALVPRCAAPQCGELLHLVLPGSETEFNARNVTVALVELTQMRDLPKGTDWFVVGASASGSPIHVTTVGDKHIDEQRAIVEGAIDSVDKAWEIPAMWQLVLMPIPIERVFLSAVKIEGPGVYRYTTVAAEGGEVDAEKRPPPKPKGHHSQRTKEQSGESAAERADGR